MKINYKNYTLTRVYRDGHDNAFKITDNDGREYRHPIFSKMFETAVTMGWKQLLQQPSTPYRTLIL